MVEGDPHQRAVLAADGEVVGGPLLADAQQVRHRGASRGARLPGHETSHDDPEPHHLWSQHDGILGWAESVMSM
ncbi:hypothetical protein GCM10009737_19940 [Nocardioides lentus]|uniref:Uncharacterized protein n=1 Tax=Nocardioides lentus TaxID=338077 RepID=A0ABP5ANC0_9ACTN